MPPFAPGRPTVHVLQSPSMPLRTNSAATRNAELPRCCDPTWNVTPVSFATRTITRPSETPSVIGFWQ